jgi:hypothetical protein
MTTRLLPDTVRKAVGHDIEPIRPLPPAWRRALFVVAAAAGVAAVGLTTVSLRFDLSDIPLWLGWGASVLELLLGFLLVALALREAVPGAGIPAGSVRLVVATAVLVQIGVGIFTWVHSSGLPLGHDWISKSMVCLRNNASLVFPVLLLTLWLVFRALPLRAPTAGLLGAGGAALAGDAVTHLLCPMSDPRHVLVWHTGALVGFMAIGWMIGCLWQRWRWR